MGSPSAKIVLSIAAVITSIVPFVADFNATHLFNPLWPPHARFHGACFLFVNIAVGGIALWLLWGREGDSRLAVRIAALLPALCWGSFFPALLVPGTGMWPDGTPHVGPVNGNMFLAAGVVILCGIGVALDGRSRAA